MKRTSKIIALASAISLTLCACNTAPKVTDNNDNSVSIPAELPAEPVTITLALNPASKDTFAKEIKEFNESHENITVETRIFGEIDDDFNWEHSTLNLWNMELIQNLINTDDVDMIIGSSFMNTSFFDNMCSKGAFADLSQFMENDPEINRSTLNSNVLSLIENNGRLCFLPCFFHVKTLFGYTEYVGSKENWTVDEMISAWDSMPPGSTVSGTSVAENTYYTILRGNLSEYIDEENAKVHFDSPDFRRILEFCTSFDYNNGEKPDYDYDAPTLCHAGVLEGFAGGVTYRLTDDGEEYVSGKEHITYVGYPSSDGMGGFMTPAHEQFAINAKSSPEKQRAAWEFIRTFFSEEYQFSHYRENYGGDNWSYPFGFPMNNEAAEHALMEEVKGTFISSEPYESKGETFVTYPPTEEYCRGIWDYVNSVRRWERHMDDELWEIINEEIMAYLAGENDIDRCIDLIQNRTSIMISEQE